ncbi:MAG: MerR family transcriptional regulator [Leptospiraceae bacterium]|nr:MerR family transcriptional regulator [Leptospiraceae bacterium]
MLIGELSQKSGLSRDTIRYYERRGLLMVDLRRENNYKEYAVESLRVLEAVARLKKHGFTLGEIDEFVDLFANQRKSCANTAPLIEKKLQEIDLRIKELSRIKRDLRRALQQCAAHPKGQACQVLESMFKA